MAVNCGGISEGLVDSDLFGHTRGAFTGAVKARRGAFERASAGTLFLDEIGELPGSVQARLLRVLEGGEVTRVGGEDPIVVGARVVAATHRDLDAEAEQGSFRQDLLYRLNVHVLKVPPLRERPEDIPRLTEHFAATLPAPLGWSPRPVSDEALAVLRERRWERNNVRELRNTIERMIIASDGPALEAVHLPPDVGGGGGGSDPLERGVTGTFREQKLAAETRIVRTALEANAWKIGQTARGLGLADHSSLLKIMNRLGIRRPED